MAKKVGLQERIKEIHEYFCGFEIKENLYIVKVIYPERWGAYPTPDGLINVARAETQDNMWFYYANVGDIDIDEMFDLIDDTIETNLSAERKVSLMKEKMYELRELFQDENNSLEKLEGLQFVFASDKPKGKRSRGVKKDKKAKETIEETPQEETITQKETMEEND